MFCYMVAQSSHISIVNTKTIVFLYTKCLLLDTSVTNMLVSSHQGRIEHAQTMKVLNGIRSPIYDSKKKEMHEVVQATD